MTQACADPAQWPGQFGDSQASLESSLCRPESDSMLQELNLPGQVGGGGSLNTQRQESPENDPFQWQAQGGSNERFNFDSPFGLRLEPPQTFTILSHAQASAGTSQVVAEATFSSSSPNSQNFNFQRRDPLVGTNPQVPASLADHQVRYPGLLMSQSSMGVGLRHVVSDETLGGGRRIVTPLTTGPTVSQERPFPPYPRDTQGVYPQWIGHSQQPEAPTASAQPKLDALSMPLPAMQGPTFQPFLQTQPPMNNEYFGYRKTPNLPPPSSKTLQDPNAQETASASLPTASGSHHTAFGERHGKNSSSSLYYSRGQVSVTPIGHTQEEVKLKVSRQRRSRLKEHSMLPLKIIQYKPNDVDDTAQLPIQPPQESIVWQTRPLAEHVKDKSEDLMLTSIFQNGFFLGENTLTQMADDALSAAVDRHPQGKAGDLKMWKSSVDGITHINKLKGAAKATFSDFQKFADIFLLPVYRLCIDLYDVNLQGKDDVLAWRAKRIESMLLNYAFIDAWIKLHVGNNNFQEFLIPFGHVAVISLIEYMMMKQGYYRYISLGTDGWEKRLEHTLAVITTVYRSAMIKLKADPGWPGEVAILSHEEQSDSEYYDEVIKRLSSLPAHERAMLNQLMAGLCRALKCGRWSCVSLLALDSYRGE
ncbi:hypothetical protein EDD22DRAFT_855118 [Suillus occidentalis]|nr:hypothetical protein EDD22DRAFT_855118 [Suillus occidentalis]